MSGMVRIKPLDGGHAVRIGDGAKYRADEILWQGIHVGAVVHDDAGKPLLFHDLPVGHSAHWGYEVDLARGTVAGPEGIDWLSRPLLDSLQAPSPKDVPLRREILHPHKDVIILNCLDMMYGHCLLKLLNASRHMADNPERGLIVLIPDFLRWLVPDGTAEIWSVPLRLREMKEFHPSLDRQIRAFCAGFDTILLSEAFSHPSRFHIADYTRTAPHDFQQEENLVTFIWREDRLWLPHYAAKKLRKAGLHGVALAWQRRKVTSLFRAIRRHHPGTHFAVTGLGCSGHFPAWIKDLRTDRFDETSERVTAAQCASSRIVIGVHGSNMLLPSGLAGMTIDLMPADKWQCLPEDILFHECNPRMAAFRYRFIPIESRPKVAAQVAAAMLQQFRSIPPFLTEDSAQ